MAKRHTRPKASPEQFGKDYTKLYDKLELERSALFDQYMQGMNATMDRMLAEKTKKKKKQD